MLLFFCLFTFTINLCSHWRKRWDSPWFSLESKRTSRRPTGMSV